MKEILCNSIQSSVLEQYLFIYIYVKKLHVCAISLVCALHTHTTNIKVLYKIDMQLNYTENHMYDTEIKENHSLIIENIYEDLKTTLQYITLLMNNSRENLYY
jgi:hypothetical protein